jgi:hypothetical protein
MLLHDVDLFFCPTNYCFSPLSQDMFAKGRMYYQMAVVTPILHPVKYSVVMAAKIPVAVVNNLNIACRVV